MPKLQLINPIWAVVIPSCSAVRRILVISELKYQKYVFLEGYKTRKNQNMVRARAFGAIFHHICTMYPKTTVWTDYTEQKIKTAEVTLSTKKVHTKRDVLLGV